MKNLIFIILLVTFSFSKDNTKDIENEFDSEYTQKQVEIFDPLSGYNRAMTTFNDYLFLNVVDPISRGYAYVTPETIRIGINNFFENIMFPVRFTNNLLQLKFQNSSEELGRFLINSLWGLGGVLDSATKELDMKPHKEDFGQTLAFYGVGDGFPIVLPFLGPSNLRDTLGLVADSYVSPLSTSGDAYAKYKIPNNVIEQISIASFNTINSVSLTPGEYESIRKDALDLYPFLRDIYSQARKKQIEE